MVPEVEENTARREMLSGYDTQDAFFDAHHAAVNHDWRKDIAGDDDKFLSKLQRFTEPSDFGNTYREAEQKIRAGDLGPAKPGAEATEEDIKAYRRDAGIPLEAAGYLENLPEGLVVGEDDKTIMLDYMGALHEIYAPTEFAHKTIEWYNGLEERMQEAQQETDTEQARTVIDELRNDWGQDYRTNMNLIKGVLASTFGDETADKLTNGRYADGTGFFNDVGIMKGFADLARKVNPVAPLIPNDATAVQGLHDEIEEIEGKMGTVEYRKSEPMQARLRELYDIRLKLDETVEA
jgi:hypothetical protein